MARVRFTVGTRYLQNGQVYFVRQLLVEGQMQVENQSFGGLVIVTMADAYAAWGRGEIRFEVRGKHSHTSQNSPLATEYTITDFEQLPAHLRAEAWRRYQLILPLLKRPPAKRTRTDIIAYAETLRPPDATERRTRGAIGEAMSWASLERWLEDFIASGYDIYILVPMVDRSARKGELRLDLEVETIMQAVLAECAANHQNLTANDVYWAVVNRIAEENRTRPANLPALSAPGSATIYRRIHTVGLERVLRRQRSRKEEQAESSVDDGPNPTRILERVEIDHTLLDVFLVDEEDRLPIGRPTLTYALDTYSGLPFGLYVGFEPPSYLTVANCLLHGILPKSDVRTLYETDHEWPTFGLPETLIVDNAKEFIGRDLDDACGHLGIILEQMPVRTPWFKGRIERFFRTNNTGLIHTLPGTTFSNILERGDYDALQHACISLSAFWKLLHVFLLDIYAQKWHKGVGGIPFKRWNESVASGFIPSWHTSAEETRILLMRTATRNLQRAGIEFENLFYRSTDSARLRTVLPKDDRNVRLKYDPSDISAVYVSDPMNNRWLRIPAVDQAYTRGLSLWKHRIIVRFANAEKGEVNIESLAAAKVKIQRIVAEEYALTRKSQGRKVASRFLGVGAPSSAPVTPPLLPPAAPVEPIAPEPAPEAPGTISVSTTPPIAPIATDDLDDLDLSGWSGDYNLPKSGGDQ